VFAGALFDAFAAAEGPGDGGVGVAHIGAGIAATFAVCVFWCVGWSGSTVAVAAVGGIEVSCVVCMSTCPASVSHVHATNVPRAELTSPDSSLQSGDFPHSPASI
jgi:hypothetical protein